MWTSLVALSTAARALAYCVSGPSLRERSPGNRGQTGHAATRVEQGFATDSEQAEELCHSP